MRKDISEKIGIPEGTDVEIGNNFVKIKSKAGEIVKKYHGFSVKKDGKTFEIFYKKATKNQKKLIKSLKAHVNNAFHGGKYVYKLQVCSVHFPMTVAVDKAKKEVVVKNFLGEVKPRLAKIVDGSEVKVDKEIITVEGNDIESAGQTAANIERSTRITNRDRRVFQDGIFITEKPGEK